MEIKTRFFCITVMSIWGKTVINVMKIMRQNPSRKLQLLISFFWFWNEMWFRCVSFDSTSYLWKLGSRHNRTQNMQQNIITSLSNTVWYWYYCSWRSFKLILELQEEQHEQRVYIERLPNANSHDWNDSLLIRSAFKASSATLLDKITLFKCSVKCNLGKVPVAAAFLSLYFQGIQ